MVSGQNDGSASMRSLHTMDIRYDIAVQTESSGIDLYAFAADYVHECFREGCSAVRAQYPDGAIEYVASNRYDRPLRWERRTVDGVTEVMCTDVVLREFAPDVDVRDATAEDFEQRAANRDDKSVPR